MIRYKATIVFFALLSLGNLGLSNTLFDAAPLADSTRNYASISVDSNPPGAIIKMNGKILGVTPLTGKKIAIGSHTLIGINPDRTDWLALDWIQNISPGPGDTLFFFIEFPKLKTTPPESEPKSPRAILQSTDVTEASPAMHSLQLTNHLSLMTDPRKPMPLVPANTSANPGKSKSWKKLAIASFIGVAALSGLASVHYRDKANSFYESYQKASNPIQMDDYFARTQHYDRLAGVSYGLFQVSFIATIYLFLDSR